MDYVEVLKHYLEMEKDLLSLEYTIGFETPNGKRLIVYDVDDRCVPINNMFKIVSHSEEENHLYKNALDCIKSYFEEVEEGSVSVPITKILLFNKYSHKEISDWFFK